MSVDAGFPGVLEEPWKRHKNSIEAGRLRVVMVYDSNDGGTMLKKSCPHVGVALAWAVLAPAMLQ